MKVRNIVRKGAVLGAGAAMLGATLGAAFAYDLSTYPSRYIADGKFDSAIVIGERASARAQARDHHEEASEYRERAHRRVRHMSS